MPNCLRRDPALGQRRLDIRAHEVGDFLGCERFDQVLMRDHNLCRLDRFAILITNGHLAFGVGTQGLLGARVARIGDPLQDLVGVIKRSRHEFRRFAAGVAEHDALIARPFILVAASVDALRNVRGLRVQQHFDLGVAPMKAVLLVADFLDRIADRRHHFLFGNFRSANLAGNDDPVGGG